MKTPEEIKKGIECCANDSYFCNEECPYHNPSSNGVDCSTKMHADALMYIQQLENENKKIDGITKYVQDLTEAAKDLFASQIKVLEHKLEAVKRERDYLLEQIKEVPSADCLFYPIACRLCDAKGKFTGEQCMICRTSRENAGFHFAGVPENSEVQDDDERIEAARRNLSATPQR